MHLIKNIKKPDTMIRCVLVRGTINVLSLKFACAGPEFERLSNLVRH